MIKKINLPTFEANLIFDELQSKSEIPMVQFVIIKSNDGEFHMKIDERFNMISFDIERLNLTTKQLEIVNFLTDRFEEIKNSDFRYKIGNGFEGDKTIRLNDFIKVVMSENRNLLLNNIIIKND